MYTYPTTFAYIKTQRRKVLANSWHFQVGRQNLPCVLFYDLMHVFSHPTTYLPTVRIFIWGTRILRVFYSKISSIHSHTLQYIYPHYNISGNQCTRTRCLANCGHFHVGRRFWRRGIEEMEDSLFYPFHLFSWDRTNGSSIWFFHFFYPTIEQRIFHFFYPTIPCTYILPSYNSYTYPATYVYVKTQGREVLANSWQFHIGPQNIPFIHLFYRMT